MRNKIYTLIAMALVTFNVSAGTLFCQVKNLATADIYGENIVQNISIVDLKQGIEFSIKHYLVEANFKLESVENQLLFTVSAQEEVDSGKAEFLIDDSRLTRKTRLGFLSISSYSTNLDTIYSYCDFIP